MDSQPVQFQKGIGRWVGSAEVFDSAGHFLGNGSDYRHVQPQENGRVRIDVSFVGPFKHSGHYFIQQAQNERLYQGPANIGHAETLSDALVDANAYWPALGMSQRFFLMVVDDRVQLSLAHMARGEHLLYVVVGQNNLVPENTPNPQPQVVSGTHYDLQSDPAAGRAEIFLQRVGTWSGSLTALDAQRNPLGLFEYTQAYQTTGEQCYALQIQGGAFASAATASFVTNQWQAWTTADGEVVGSCSLSGGRAASGQFYHRQSNLRCWQREVATLDGQRKALLQHWYHGGQRIGSQFGVMEFHPA